MEPRRSGRVETVVRCAPARCGAVAAVALAVCGLGFVGAALANQGVDIFENDGILLVDTLDPTKLIANYVVWNRSNVEPPGNPYNKKITQVQLYDLSSVATPTKGTFPAGWQMTMPTAGSGPNLWNVMFYATSSLYYLNPGAQKIFPVFTYRPASLPDIVVGTRYGQGRLEVEGWQPPLPGDDFLGPLGIRGDLDHDGDHDADDWLLLAACLQGPDAAVDCPLADYDADTDVDLADFAAFQTSLGS